MTQPFITNSRSSDIWWLSRPMAGTLVIWYYRKAVIDVICWTQLLLSSYVSNMQRLIPIDGNRTCLVRAHHDDVMARELLPHSLLWRHNGRDGVPNHQPHECLLNCSLRRRSKKASKPLVTGLCEENSPVTGEFPTQMANNAENVSIWWRHHDVGLLWVRPVDSPYTMGQKCLALLWSWTVWWTNSPFAVDLRRAHVHIAITVMMTAVYHCIAGYICQYLVFC